MKRIILGTILSFYCALAQAQSPKKLCDNMAATPLEETYCEVTQGGRAKSLPSLNEFRKNPEKIQRLLLKRPARKLGISLPDSAELKSKTDERLKAVALVERKENALHKRVSRLEQYCSLEGPIIECAGVQYGLLQNQRNSKLSSTALSKSNKLTLPLFLGESIEQEENAYLQNAYLLYIEAMVSIGLGASTMSFTKFYYTFKEVGALGAGFSERMASMFEFLKKDKSTIAIKMTFNDLLPQDLAKCMVLSSELIACDNVKQNWVYRVN